MESVAEYLLQRWDTLSKAPDVFLLSVLIVAGGCYALLNALFKTRLETKDAIIEGLKAKLERKEEALVETHDQLARLRTDQAAALAAQPTEAFSGPEPATDVPQNESGKVQRDVTVSEALAYAQFHVWHLRFIDAAGMEGNQVTDHLDQFVQYAADGELTIWGKKEEAGVWQKIPVEHWLDYRIEWFGLLKSDAFTEDRRSVSLRGNYRELMTSKAQVEQLCRPAPTPVMQMANAIAPSVKILKARILDARDRFEAMDATDDQLARIRLTMSSLALSEEPVWQNDALDQARQELLHLWERLSHNVDWIGRQSQSAAREPNYFRNEIERSEMLMEVNDAVRRLDAGLSGSPIPAKEYLGPDFE